MKNLKNSSTCKGPPVEPIFIKDVELFKTLIPRLLQQHGYPVTSIKRRITMSNLAIMEDIKHKFMWNTIIDILNDLRKNYNLRFQLNTRYRYLIPHPETKEEKRVYVSKLFTISELEHYIFEYIFNNENIYLHSYLCDYTFQKAENNSNLVNMSCNDCPAKIMTSQFKLCLNGYRTMVTHVQLKNIPHLEQEAFNIIVRYCEKIRDIEYKPDVLLRSQIK